MNLYDVSFWDHRRAQQRVAIDGSGWMYFKVLAENEAQIIEHLDASYPNRKNCMFDRHGEPSDVAHDWTEIKLMKPIKFPHFIEENK